MRVSKEDLKSLIKNKLHKAGLNEEHASTAADVLVFADERGIHSHGAMRVEYYAERIAKGGMNTNPDFKFEKTGPATGVFHGDGGNGHTAAKLAMDEAIKMAKESGVAIVGVRDISHSGAISYFTNQAAESNLIGFSVCQSDPMVVPFGGAEPYYGTNPIAFAAPSTDDRKMTLDMATTVQAWGKILHARSKNQTIPDTWAVDGNGEPTTDPYKVNALLPISGPKGYGLAMMVDVLSGVLLGLPFGNKVSSMYENLSEYRKLGQLHIVINPEFFMGITGFQKDISQSMDDLNGIKPAPGFDKVLYPGQNNDVVIADYKENGIEIVDDIYDYLKSDVIHNNQYDHKNPFAE
ncbi:ureidoglycolate dehydrogenase [Rummeliibacillus sp. G93]|uniref:ureidoglycolate dehydrogenase n=1 Tax=Rummeliibacillus TaxID=648802 RepID=UPI00117214D6|nr:MULTISPECIES: ureidoglycolate dehydrogenase [Rummeliibacillus]MBB5169341.1 ureidoglycolate dehydrogenase (NAD+) [Rummeliibacillus stabekisii]UQW98903.1 ureidoglycolate dehydrogenase [Rummeliibacillus sp. G93]GEL03603.1 ureidoglycolate dehydrogenase [Rummeliibacillus stabekisii]